MFNKVKVIVSGVFACASLHMYAGLFDSVSKLAGGLVTIDEGDATEETTSAKTGKLHTAKDSSNETSGKGYIADRDAFIELVKENWGATASAFNMENRNFQEIQKFFPDEAEALAENAARLRGSVFSNLKYVSDKKEGMKLLKRLSSEETELRAVMEELKAKTMQRQAEIDEARSAELKAETEKRRGDIALRDFNFSERMKAVNQLTSIAIKLKLESNEGMHRFESSLPRAPESDWANGGHTNPVEVENWIAAVAPMLESRIVELYSMLETSDEGSAFLEQIHKSEGRNADNTPLPVFSWKNEEGASASIKLGMTPVEVWQEGEKIKESGFSSGLEENKTMGISESKNSASLKNVLEFAYSPVAETGAEVLSSVVLKFERQEYMPPMEPVKAKYRKMFPDAVEGSFFMPTGETYLDEEGLKKDGSMKKLQELRRKSEQSALQWRLENTQAAFEKSMIETQNIERQQEEILKAHTIAKKMECPMFSCAGYEIVFVWNKRNPVVSQIIFVDRRLQDASKDISERKQKAAANAAKAKADAEAKAKLEKQLDF